jgi:FKBP-type peptidyl-prolyl cis-trans isomerase
LYAGERIELKNLNFIKGPGETNALPISTAEYSQIETAKLVVSAAIFALSLQLNIENALNEIKRLTGANENSDGYPQGVQYREINVGTGPKLVPQDDFEIELNVFYNGMELPRKNGLTGYRLTSSALSSGEYPSGIIREGLKGIRLGGRRNISIPASSIIDSVIVPDKNDIPSDATIVLDIRLLSMTQSVKS